MKKYITAALAIIMCLGMAACGDSGNTAQTTTTAATETSTTVTTAAPETATTTTTTTTAESAVSETTTEKDMLSALKPSGAKAPEGVYEFSIQGGGQVLGKSYLSVIIADDYSNYYKIDVDDPELEKALFDFLNEYNIKADLSSGKLEKYELIDNEGNNLGMLSAEQIREKFDPSAGYDIIKWSYDGEVKLSELEESKVYQAPVKDNCITFVNDTDTDYLVHVSDTYEYRDEVFAYPAKVIGETPKKDIYKFEDVRVRIEKLTADMLSPEDPDISAAFVNDAAKGEEIESIGFSDFLVNAGNESVTVDITEKRTDAVTELTLKAGDIYSIDPDNIAYIIVK